MPNKEDRVIRGFGREWKAFDQSALDPNERLTLFEQYFSIFPWSQLPPGATGFDLGCGSGRWAWEVSRRVHQLHCIDPSEEALNVARANLEESTNCVFHRASVDDIPLEDDSMDFGYSLGVLHHVPDTAAGIANCARKLKAGAPFLIYLYYAFDNRPSWFRLVWRTTESLRFVISRLPFLPRRMIAELIALFVYLPMSRAALALEAMGFDVGNIPLSAYRRRTFYVMRTDALDRFGTIREHRFSAAEICQMMAAAGLERIEVSPNAPYWCAVGVKQKP